MAFETISYEELRVIIAEWSLLNKRSSPLTSGGFAEEFLENFTIPETGFELTQSYSGQNGEIIVLFKTVIHLHAWQTRNGREPADFSYYKITEAVTDGDGNILDYHITGYVVAA